MQKTLRRLPLSVKQAGREYYKGNKTGTLGTIDKYGRFHPDYTKIRTFVYPAKGTEDFEVCTPPKPASKDEGLCTKGGN
jgi:large subunit ribosomal protein L41